MTAGIYALMFNEYDPFYIGQSVNIEKRFKEHLYALARGDSNGKLLYAYKNYGNPELIILEECDTAVLNDRELHYINALDTVTTGLNEWAGPVSVCRGQAHPNAKYTDLQILEVIKLLASEKFISFKDISAHTKVSISSIENVSCGKVGSHLKDIVPIEYSIMEAKKGNRVSFSSSAKGRGIVYPTILSPSGEEYNIENVTKFAKEHSLNLSHVCGVLHGVRKSHKGWKLK
jgi:group I intron endonuclease